MHRMLGVDNLSLSIATRNSFLILLNLKKTFLLSSLTIKLRNKGSLGWTNKGSLGWIN